MAPKSKYGMKNPYSRGLLRKDLTLEEIDILRTKDREYHKLRSGTSAYKEYRKRDYQENKVKRNLITKKSTVKTKYGISWKEFEELYEKQQGRCAICNGEEKNRMLSIDHCHVTQKVRGLLCGSCNRALGLFKDSPVLLQAAKEYVS